MHVSRFAVFFFLSGGCSRHRWRCVHRCLNRSVVCNAISCRNLLSTSSANSLNRYSPPPLLLLEPSSHRVVFLKWANHRHTCLHLACLSDPAHCSKVVGRPSVAGAHRNQHSARSTRSQYKHITNRCLRWVVAVERSTNHSACIIHVDPTAGPSANEVTRWNLDEKTLHENIKKTLVKLCVPSPTVLRCVTPPPLHTQVRHRCSRMQCMLLHCSYNVNVTVVTPIN